MSDMRLTTKTYMDSSLLATADALEMLPRYEMAEDNALQATGTEPNVRLTDGGQKGAQIGAQLGVCSGHVLSRSVASDAGADSEERPVNIGESRDVSLPVATGQDTSINAPARTRT